MFEAGHTLRDVSLRKVTVVPLGTVNVCGSKPDSVITTTAPSPDKVGDEDSGRGRVGFGCGVPLSPPDKRNTQIAINITTPNPINNRYLPKEFMVLLLSRPF